MSETFSDSSSAGPGDDMVMGNSSVFPSTEDIDIHSHPQDHEDPGAYRTNSIRSPQEHDPQIYLEQVTKIPHGMANSCESALESNTDAPPPRNQEHKDNYFDWLREDIEYSKSPPKRRTPDPNTTVDANRKVLLYDVEEINETIEKNLNYHEDRDGNIRGSHLHTAYSHVAQIVAERSSVRDGEQFQVPDGQDRNQRALLPAIWSDLSDPQSSSHISHDVASHEIEAKSFHHEETHQSAAFDEESVPQLQELMKPFKPDPAKNGHQPDSFSSESFDFNFSVNHPLGSGEVAGLGKFLYLPESFKPRIAQQRVELNYYNLDANPQVGNAELEELVVSDEELSPQLQQLQKPFKPKDLRSSRKYNTAPQGAGKSLNPDKLPVRRSARIHNAQFQEVGKSVDTDKPLIPRATRKHNAPTLNAINSPPGDPPLGSALWKKLNDPPEGSSQRKADYLSSLSIGSGSRPFSPKYSPIFHGFEENFHQSPYPQLILAETAIESLPTPCAASVNDFQVSNFGYDQNAKSGYEELVHFDVSLMDPADRELYNGLDKIFEFDGKTIYQPMVPMSEEPLLNEANQYPPVENQGFKLQGLVNNDPNNSQVIAIKYPTLFDDDYSVFGSEQIPGQGLAKRNIDGNYNPESGDSIVVDHQATLSGTAIGLIDTQSCINQPYSNLSNDDYMATGQEYLQLRYLAPQLLSPFRYQRLRELACRLGPDVVTWLEYTAEKRGFVKREAEEREDIKTREDGYTPPLGYDPLDENLTAEQENQEAERCHNAAVEVFGLDPFGGENEDMIRQIYTLNPSEEPGLLSEEFNALLDDKYMEVDPSNTVDERPARRPRLSLKDYTEPKSEPIAMPQQKLTVSASSKRSSGQNDSPTSTASLRISIMDIQVLVDDEGRLVPTRPRREGQNEVPMIRRVPNNNEASIIPKTPKMEVELPAIKSTKKVFDRFKARNRSVPQTEAWSRGKAVARCKPQFPRPILPRGLTESSLAGLRNSDISQIAPNSPRSSREGIIHSQESRFSGSQHQSHQGKPSQSNAPPKQQSWGYPSNLAVAIPTQTSPTSFEIQDKSDHGAFLIGGKPNSQPANQKSITHLAFSPSQDQAPQQTIRTLKAPQTAYNSFSRIGAVPAMLRMQSHQAPHFANNLTMSTYPGGTNEDFMAGQQRSPIQQDNSPTPTGYGTVIPSGSSSGSTVCPINSLSSQSRFPVSSSIREVAYGSFGTPVERANAIIRFNSAVRQHPDKYGHLMIVITPNADPAVLEISGPLGSNVRGAMREIFPAWGFSARIG